VKRTLVIAAALWLAVPTAEGNAGDLRPDTVFTQFASGDETQSWSVGGQWDWRRQWRVTDSLRLGGRWEIAVGRWWSEAGVDGEDRAWVTQFSLIPNLRLSSAYGDGWYAQVGSGPSLLLPLYYSNERRFSTKFNFQSHLAVGYVAGIGGEHDFGVRIEHFSNAGIREPNPGVNLVSLRYTYRFGDRGPRLSSLAPGQ
jgi:hypothetical protein